MSQHAILIDPWRQRLLPLEYAEGEYWGDAFMDAVRRHIPEHPGNWQWDIDMAGYFVVPAGGVQFSVAVDGGSAIRTDWKATPESFRHSHYLEDLIGPGIILPPDAGDVNVVTGGFVEADFEGPLPLDLIRPHINWRAT